MIGQSEKNDHILMSLVAHGFGRVEFRISNISFDSFKYSKTKQQQIFEIRHFHFLNLLIGSD